MKSASASDLFRPWLACLLSCTLALSACSDYDDSPPLPATPTNLSVSYAVKSYAFAWSASATATHYELAEDPDGAGPLPETMVADGIVGASYTHSVFLPLRLNAQYRVRACNADGCSAFTDVITPNLTEAIGYFKASNAQADDLFGGASLGLGPSLALSGDGNTLAVGAQAEASNAVGINGNQGDNSAPYAGAVYVFTRSAGAWVQQAYVKASNTDAGDYFGTGVALSFDGNTLAVSAYRESSTATGVNGNQLSNGIVGAGAVYVFSRTDGAWSQQAYVKASNTSSVTQSAHFGNAIALSSDGNTLAVAAYLEDSDATGIDGNQNNDNATNAGAVYVFTRSTNSGSPSWSQQAYIKGANTEAGDYFGRSVALSSDGNTLAVGAINEASAGSPADNSVTLAGAVYVFSRSAGSWSQQAYIKASNPGANDLFGWALALSGDGNTLAVSAYGEASNATGMGGNQSDNSAAYAGAVYMFVRSGVSWSQQAYIKASNTQANDYFGYALALSGDGNTLAVGAPNEASNASGIGGNQGDNSLSLAGAAYLFSRTGTSWSQQAYVKASNPGSPDQFGWALALSHDGTTLAVSAREEASSATGMGGNQSDNSAAKAGAVYLY